MLLTKSQLVAIIALGVSGCAPAIRQMAPTTVAVEQTQVDPVDNEPVVQASQPAASIEPQKAVKADTVSILPPAATTKPPSIISPYDSAWSAVRISIDSIVSLPSFRTASWGILILHENGDTIYSKNAHTLLVAASNMKVVTAAVSLAELGAGYKFRPNYLRLGLTDPMPSDYGSTYDVQTLRSGTLGNILPTMLKNSHNRLAEQIFRTIGLEKTKTPTRDSAAAAVTRSLIGLGIPVDGFNVHDGSGYDRKNYLSAETLVRLLTIFRTDSVFVNSMTVGGVDGTLMRRFRNTPAMGNIFAKTGSLNGIRSLSGYVFNVAGERLTFALLCNAYSISPTGINATLDSILVKVASVDVAPGAASSAKAAPPVAKPSAKTKSSANRSDKALLHRSNLNSQQLNGAAY